MGAAGTTQERDAAVEPDVDVVIVGAGILGIHQLYGIDRAGFSVQLVEAGTGVGGTWFWNRYPGARFDSESWAYAYLFSEELFAEWKWDEYFAGQPEIERYLNHVVDRYSLRRHIRLGVRVTAAVWDEPSGTWLVHTDDGAAVRCRFLISATGRLSVPFTPDIPGRDDFRGEAHHTGLWPSTPVDFRGKRVAVIGTGSSGVQIIPEILGDVASLTVYQRTPNWCTPLNNAPLSDEEHADMVARFDRIRDTLNTSETGFLHEPSGRRTFDDTKEERWKFYEDLWTNARGFARMNSNYIDLASDPAANAEYCEFMAEKIRALVHDPEVAEQLIPKDHGFAAKRPPMVTGYYESYNDPKVRLVNLTTTPIVRVTETGIETTAGSEDFDIIVWATGFDFGTGALTRMGIRGVGGLSFEEHWKDGPNTFLGLQSVGFPNFFFPGGPHGSPGNSPRSGGDMVEFIVEVLEYMRDHDLDVIETTEAAEELWNGLIEEGLAKTPFTDISYFYGTNIPGKPRRYLLNPNSRSDYLNRLRELVANGFREHLVATRLADRQAGRPVSRR
jgi:cation diffusion facilitator CzcD-associated flavoprotein CzcO